MKQLLSPHSLDLQTVAELHEELVKINAKFDELLRSGRENTLAMDENHRQFERWCSRFETVFRQPEESTSDT